jgi:hypothetical protein
MKGHMAPNIAEAKLVGLRASGERFDVTAAVGQPHRVDAEEWACPVSLSGLQRALPDIHGSSSLQALCLAASLLRELLTSFVQEGGRLLYEDGSEPFDISSCFSRVGRSGDGSI